MSSPVDIRDSSDPTSRLFDLSATPIEGGMTVVEASAGTGKTYCLTGLVLRLLLERKVRDVSELLVVTFTRAATQELVERIRGALRELSLLLAGEGGSDDAFLLGLAATYRGDDEARRLVREALVRFDDLTVSTIHGFCQRVLRDAAFESGAPFTAELLEDDAPLLLEVARDAWRSLLYPAPRLVAAVVADEGWDPSSFLADYRLWRSHPRTEILPEPTAWDAAVESLLAARKELRAAFERGAVRAHLERRRFRARAYFGGGALDERLREAEAFCTPDGAGDPAGGLRAVRELAVERLTASIFKRDSKGVGRHPAVRAATAFSAAADALGHALRCRFLAEVDERFEAAKRGAVAVTYDDLLRRLRDALGDPGRGPALARDLRRRYRAALIDEFQDTDLVQYDIFRRLFRSGPLFLIGDPKQAIYRFRGADVFAYLAARGEADRTYTLGRNWRAEASLVDAVAAVFGRAEKPFVFDRIAFRPVEAARQASTGDSRPPLEWLWIPRQATRDETRVAIEQAVAAEVARLLTGETASDPLEPGDVAVLVRTNDEAAAMQAALTAARVPAIVGRAGDIFETEEMAELERLLAAVADPGYAPRLRAAWATRSWGDDARAIGDLNRDDEAFARRLERFADYREDWRRRGFMPMIQRLLAEHRVRGRLLAAPAGARRLTNLDHAVEVLHRAERRRHPSPAALLAWLAAERARARTAAGRPASEDTELRLATDADAVQIVTVHRSKGLEYEIVFCPYLWEARPVDSPPVSVHVETERLVLDCGSERLAEHLALAEAERLSEDARLVYVALTRARRRCYVAWGDVPGRDGPEMSALGYLLRPARPGEASSGASPSPADWTRRALEEVRAGRERWRCDLEALVARHADVMKLRELDAAGQASAVPALVRGSAGRTPRARRFRGTVPPPWSLESFSSLSRGGEAETPDHVDPATPEAARAGDAPAGGVPEGGIRAFARGRRAGACLHQVLEHCDLARLDDVETGRAVTEALARHGLADAASHRPPAGGAAFEPAAAVLDLMRRLATTRVPGEAFTLGAVPRASSLVEWKFTTPLAGGAARQLAHVFRRLGSGAVRDDYAPRLEGLEAGAVRGYLTGFVDLIFTHDGRWYLFDWKSNDLGSGAEAYGRESLWQTMCHHHYVLQYHLYLFALHRFLRRRLPDYDYERHVAGAYYVFLRGLDGGGAAGWFVDRPPWRLIAALDTLIDGGTAP